MIVLGEHFNQSVSIFLLVTSMVSGEADQSAMIKNPPQALTVWNMQHAECVIRWFVEADPRGRPQRPLPLRTKFFFDKNYLLAPPARGLVPPPTEILDPPLVCITGRSQRSVHIP